MDGAAEFGRFRLLVTARQLLKDGQPVAMGGRALELLTLLVERHGDVVSRDELLARAWPNLFVEEANLRVQMAALRRVLGDGQDGERYIVNVARRGYSFVGDVHFTDAPSHEPLASEPPASVRHNLPNPLLSVFGREAEVDAVQAALSKARLVTLVGSGGVGKTTLALQFARRSLQTFDAFILVELAQVSDLANVESSASAAIAMTLGVDRAPLVDMLPIGRSLIILDNYEHVADAAALVGDGGTAHDGSRAAVAEVRNALCSIVFSAAAIRRTAQSQESGDDVEALCNIISSRSTRLLDNVCVERAFGF